MAKSKMSKGWKTFFMITVPLLIAGVVIYVVNKGKRKGAEKADDALKNSNAAKPKVAANPGLFPLKGGSNNDLVQALQQALIAAYGSSVLPKYGADGDWGSETSSAVKSKLGVSSIASQAAYDNAIGKLVAVANANNNAGRANQLVSTWKSNLTSQLMGGSGGALVEQYVADAFGALKLTGQKLFIGKNEKKPRDQWALLDVSKNGFVLLQKLPGSPGGPEGYYKADPNDITVA